METIVSPFSKWLFASSDPTNSPAPLDVTVKEPAICPPVGANRSEPVRSPTANHSPAEALTEPAVEHVQDRNRANAAKDAHVSASLAHPESQMLNVKLQPQPLQSPQPESSREEQQLQQHSEANVPIGNHFSNVNTFDNGPCAIEASARSNDDQAQLSIFCSGLESIGTQDQGSNHTVVHQHAIQKVAHRVPSVSIPPPSTSIMAPLNTQNSKQEGLCSQEQEPSQSKKVLLDDSISSKIPSISTNSIMEAAKTTIFSENKTTTNVEDAGLPKSGPISPPEGTRADGPKVNLKSVVRMLDWIISGVKSSDSIFKKTGQRTSENSSDEDESDEDDDGDENGTLKSNPDDTGTNGYLNSKRSRRSRKGRDKQKSGTKTPNLPTPRPPRPRPTISKTRLKIFVGTWNMMGQIPNLHDGLAGFLDVNMPSTLVPPQQTQQQKERDRSQGDLSTTQPLTPRHEPSQDNGQTNDNLKAKLHGPGSLKTSFSTSDLSPRRDLDSLPSIPQVLSPTSVESLSFSVFPTNDQSPTQSTQTMIDISTGSRGSGNNNSLLKKKKKRRATSQFFKRLRPTLSGHQQYQRSISGPSQNADKKKELPQLPEPIETELPPTPPLPSPPSPLSSAKQEPSCPGDTQEPFLEMNAKAPYHIIVINTQECEREIREAVLFPSKLVWEKQLKVALGAEYVMIKTETMAALHIAVFVWKPIEGLVRAVDSSSVATGIGGIIGNKGAVAVSIYLGNTSFLFVNSHLTAHQSQTHARNSDYKRIVQEMQLNEAPKTSPRGWHFRGDMKLRRYYDYLPTSPTSQTSLTSLPSPVHGNGVNPLTNGATPPSTHDVHLGHEKVKSDAVHVNNDSQQHNGPFGAGLSTANLIKSGEGSKDRLDGPVPSHQGSNSSKGSGHSRHHGAAESHPQDITQQFDYTFWAGDLNYRVDLSRTDAEGCLKRGDLETMLTHDQLLQQRAAGAVFDGFHEAPITFPPTYKFDPLTPASPANGLLGPDGRHLRPRPRTRSMSMYGTLGGNGGFLTRPRSMVSIYSEFSPPSQSHPSPWVQYPGKTITGAPRNNLYLHDNCMSCPSLALETDIDHSSQGIHTFLHPNLSDGSQYGHNVDPLKDEAIAPTEQRLQHPNALDALPKRRPSLTRRLSMSKAIQSIRIKKPTPMLSEPPLSQNSSPATTQFPGLYQSPVDSPLLDGRSESPESVAANVKQAKDRHVVLNTDNHKENSSESTALTAVCDPKKAWIAGLTSKYDTSSKQRIPSWTDRILWRSTKKDGPPPIEVKEVAPVGQSKQQADESEGKTANGERTPLETRIDHTSFEKPLPPMPANIPGTETRIGLGISNEKTFSAKGDNPIMTARSEKRSKILNNFRLGLKAGPSKIARSKKKKQSPKELSTGEEEEAETEQVPEPEPEEILLCEDDENQSTVVVKEYMAHHDVGHFSDHRPVTAVFAVQFDWNSTGH
ncbi:inositol polyphosphate 5-phosphatase [Lunasporangiospora selenospora]|uniref:Inositol polyphosphate 5-phosphatase n=1 Tax=Lunasporangiospora selenospora TaxID=979761 RepID=A0A9P6KEP8_9FUNG|nr:inositol polyphosphate 5-phosphatase [Lunasporangiospora selenospora]